MASRAWRASIDRQHRLAPQAATHAARGLDGHAQHRAHVAGASAARCDRRRSAYSLSLSSSRSMRQRALPLVSSVSHSSASSSALLPALHQVAQDLGPVARPARRRAHAAGGRPAPACRRWRRRHRSAPASPPCRPGGSRPARRTMRRSPRSLLRSSRSTPSRTVNAAVPRSLAPYRRWPGSSWMSAIWWWISASSRLVEHAEQCKPPHAAGRGRPVPAGCSG